MPKTPEPKPSPAMLLLRAALIRRRQQLGLSQRVVDDLAGLQPGYTGKLECGTRGYGNALVATIEALGLVLVHATSEHPDTSIISIASEKKHKKLFFLRAQKGARTLNYRMTPDQRRARSRKAALARWSKVKAAK